MSQVKKDRFPPFLFFFCPFDLQLLSNSQHSWPITQQLKLLGQVV